MSSTRHFTLGLMLFCLCGLSWWLSRTQAQQLTPQRPVSYSQGEAILQHLKQTGQFDSLQEAMGQARYSVRRAENTPLGRAAWHAPNPSAGYDGYVTEDGVSIAVGKDSYVSLSLRGIGYGNGLSYISAGKVSGDKQAIRIEREGPLKEWYVNGEGGLEQGFTLNEPPNGMKQPGLKLRLALQVNKGWHAVASADGQRVTLLGKKENEAIDYGKLVVWDAHGSPVKAALLVEDERVIIEVDDTNAAYPLTIDPNFALQQKLTASNGAANDRFGNSVAISGETVVVGAYFDGVGANPGQGSAYVFVRNGAMWSQQAQLTAMEGVAGDNFGFSVAISSDTVVVGAIGHDVGANMDQGAAYVFVRSGATWTQQAQLTASGGAANDNFGNSVAISGDTVVAGAFQDDVGANFDQGSAYVFVRSGMTWSQQAQLIAAGGVANDSFGYSVGVSGETVVVGAYFDTVGGRAAQGSAIVFVRSGVLWSQQAQLTASDGASGDRFGISVAISGDTVVVGAYFDNVGINGDQGSAYVFVRSGTTWNQQAQLTAADGGAFDSFGISVAISGEMVVVGAFQDNVGANADQGTAYVFVRNGTTWGQQPQLTAADGAADDRFGISVAISGEMVIVGAHLDDVQANVDQGSAYVFVMCRYDLSPSSQNFPATGSSSSFNVICPSQCVWTATASPEWLAITGSASGTGSGTVSFNVATNPGGPRSGSINVSGSSFVVTQDGTCILTLNPAALPGGITNTVYNQMLMASGGNGTYSYQLTNATMLPLGLSLSTGGIISGTPTAGSQGNYTFTIGAVDTNGCIGARTYTMNIATCAVTALAPTNNTVDAAGGAFNFTVTAPECAWTAMSQAEWLTVTTNSSGTGNLAVGYSVAANPGAARTGLITVNNLVFTVTQNAANTGLQFYPLPAPVRLLDTRPGASPNACSQPNTPIAGQTTRILNARNFCTIPANAAALTGNVTTVQSGGGFLTLYPSDAAQPTVASTNYGVNEIINNVFTVGLGEDGAFKIFAHNTTDVVVDVTGYYAPPGGGGLYFHPLPAPVRLLETRPGLPVGCVKPGVPLAGMTDSTQQAISLCTGIPAAARAIVGNATTVDPQGNGFLTLFPGDATRPLVASSNYNFGQIVNGPFSVGLAANGEFKIYTHWTTHLVVDVLGYYSPEANDVNGAGLLFNPLPKPVRLLETRPGLPVGCFKPGLPLAGGSETTQPARGLCDSITIPANALGVVGNATVVFPAGQGFLTLWPSTAARPLIATSNYNPGDVGNRHFIVGLSQVEGAFKIYTHATSDLVIDLSGYFAP